MITVQACLGQKPNRLITALPGESVNKALGLMKGNRVRAVLVVEANRLVGIVTQGDCAIRVLHEGRDADATLIRDVMTADPMTVKPEDPLEACMGVMANRNIRHLPVVDRSQVVGVISIGDIVKDMIRQLGQQVSYLETYIKGHGA